jgi:localization factor PodJL
MKFGVPWSVKGIRPEARETAKEAARRSGMSLGDWLNSVILHQAAEDGVQAQPLAYDDDDAGGDELSTVHQRLDDLTRRIEHFTRTGPAAYAPKRSRNEPDQIAELVGRLDRRLDQFVNNSRAMLPPAPAMMPSVNLPILPNVQLPPALDRAVAEITARQRALNGQPGPARQRPQVPAAAPMPMPAPAPVLAPAPAQDLSGLEGQLRRITDQIETLRRPGVEEAINALRAELGEIGRALNDAMPRHAIDTIEKQIQGLSQRIAEGRQAGVDGGALSGVEHGLVEVRDALRGLTPAENLVGFHEAVAGLAHKIDLIVAQKDPATLQQLEHAITTLRDMAGHVASNDAVSGLATQVQMLGEKVEQISMSSGASDALNNLEHRIAALSDALAERAQSGGTVPPMLEALVQSLSDKIELIQQSRGDNVAVGHLEDRIVTLVERLDASDSRLGHLEAIERGLADLLVHIEDLRANKEAGGLRAENMPGVDALKHDIARTQDALEAVNGTLGHVVDRLVMIEKGIRGEGRPRPVSDAEFSEITQPVGKVAVRMVSETPQAAAPARAPAPPAAPAAAPLAAPPPPPAAPPAPAPKRLPPASRLPINPDLPPDQPLEPGSGPPPLRANPAARIAASEAALGGARPATAAAPGGKSGFIAAARRAAQAAVLTPRERTPNPEPIEADESETSPLRTKLMKRVKSLFIAASIIAVVVGSIQIAGNFFDFGNSDAPNVKTAKGPDADTSTSDTAALSDKPAAPATLAANPLDLPKLPGIAPLALPTRSNLFATTPPLELNPAPQGLTPQGLTSLLNPPLLESKTDITGSISRHAGNAKPARPPAPPSQPATPMSDRLPIAIGGSQLRSAAMAGDGAAAYAVAVRFAEGRGVPVNLEEAARWYDRAASKGLAPAQFRYASMLEKGQGVKKDLAQARRLYLAAAAQENGKAMHNLAVLYAEGIEGKPDYGTAALWFRKAAQRGIADSQYNLGVLCARGLGTEKSFDEAYKWFALAAAQGDREAAKKRDEIASHLDAQALAAAQKTVKSFAPTAQPQDANVVAEPPGGWDRTTAGPPAHVKSRPARPLALGAFEVGKQ